MATAADEAWRRCREAWPEPVPAAVIVVPGDDVQATAAMRDGAAVPGLAGRSPAAAPVLVGAAATTVVVGVPPRARSRIHLAPAATARLSDEGLRVVLTHECVHVALSTRARPEAPRWLVEGVADFVAYGASTVDRAGILRPVRVAAERTGRPPDLPRDADFEVRRPGGTDRLTTVYATSLSAADAYARRHGRAALIRLVAEGTPDGGRDRDAYRSLERDLLPGWHQDLLDEDGRKE